MLLHEFMNTYRSEILNECTARLTASGDTEILTQYLAEFFDETLHAVRRDAGIRDSRSPLPATSDAAARFGADRQKAGLPVTKIPVMFAAISQSVGKLGEQYDLMISAEEYKRLNACLDAGVATSIENYSRADKTRESTLITEQVGFITHELRNALGNASLAFKLLRANGLDTNGRTADVLGRNLIKMESLIGQSQARAQLDAGVAPVLAPVHLASILWNIEAAAIPDKNISLALQVEPSLIVEADEMLLSSAVTNLVHNAVKFSRPGATVQLRARGEEALAVIEVEDECGGLATENIQKMFEPYVKRRAGNQTGSGLGLSIAKRAVQAMNGELDVENKPGHGCVFSIRLARHRV